MLNYKEIKKRREEFPEPPEVTEIRKKILSSFSKIEFVPETHQYFLPLDDGSRIEYDCVSNVTHRFAPKVDWDIVAENYALKHGMPVDDVKESWHYNNIRATNSGTGVHLYGEMWMELFLGSPDNIDPVIKPQFEDGYLIPHSPKEEAVRKYNENMFHTPNLYPVLAETRVYTGVGGSVFKQNYAGTFDILYYYKNPKNEAESGLIIMDYKTNADLYKEGSRTYGKTLLEPFGNLYDEPISYYILQLSCYQIPLEDIGLKVLGRRVVWLRDTGEYEFVKLPDVTKTLRELFS